MKNHNVRRRLPPVLAPLVLAVLGATSSALACVVGTGTSASCSEAVAKAHADFAARVSAAARRAPWTGPETSGDDLKKRDTTGLDAAREHGRQVGAALVKAAGVARERAALAGAASVPAHAIVDSYAERDRLRALRKAAGWVSDARLKESEQVAEALAEPVRRAPFMPAPTPAPPSPHADDDRLVAAERGSAELAAAAAEAAAGAPAWLDRLHGESLAGLVKRARRLPVGAGPRAGA